MWFRAAMLAHLVGASSMVGGEYINNVATSTTRRSLVCFQGEGNRSQTNIPCCQDLPIAKTLPSTVLSSTRVELAIRGTPGRPLPGSTFHQGRI